jgi:hypothetical protein
MPLGLRGTRITEAGVAPGVDTATTSLVALRALEKAGANESQHERATEYHGRLPPRQVLEIGPHGPGVLIPEVVGDLVNLAGDRVGQTGDPLLVFGPEVLGGTPQRRRDGTDLFRELALALAQTRAGAIAGLLQRALGLAYHLVLDIPNLFPGATTGLLTAVAPGITHV